MKYLISGIPGSGKTSFGNFLRDNKKYLHIDLEDPTTLQEFSQSPEMFITNISRNAHNVVVTGGFKASAWAYTMVTFFMRNNFLFIWFDGNHEAAKKAFIKRGTVPIPLFDEKIKEVHAAHETIMHFNPRIINTFDIAGNFKSFEEIFNEINT